MTRMLVHATLVCSDEACAAQFVAEGALAEIEAMACGCGGALQVLEASPVPYPIDPFVVLEPVGEITASRATVTA
jgi:hypothetical protein